MFNETYRFIFMRCRIMHLHIYIYILDTLFFQFIQHFRLMLQTTCYSILTQILENDRGANIIITPAFSCISRVTLLLIETIRTCDIYEV